MRATKFDVGGGAMTMLLGSSPRRHMIVTVAAAGDHGKPRPAVVVQSGAFPDTHASVIICQMTSTLVDAPDFRPTIEPNNTNGLRRQSQIMVDKPTTVRRERIGSTVGQLGPDDLRSLDVALAFVFGLADA